jgi:hypothetical protein
MNNKMQYLIEDYYTNTEQLKNLMKDSEKAQRKYAKENDARHAFLISAMGKQLYNKLINHGAQGTFAPIPVSAFKFTLDDFNKFRVANGYDSREDKLMKVIEWLARFYFGRDFKIVNNELYTDIAFIDIDEFIDFYMAIYKAFSAVYRVKYPKEELLYDVFNKKIRKYLS